MSDEVITVSDTGGKKGTKPAKYSLIPVQPLKILAEHYAKGNEKYPPGENGIPNYMLGYNWSYSFDALMRHLEAFRGGEDIDEETGTPHIIAVAWHAFTLSEFMRVHPEYDDRIRL